MQIVVKYFAIIREITGKSEEHFTLDSGASTKELWETILLKYPLKEHESYLRFAVNLSYVDHPCPLTAGDEVALITPVAGG